MAAKELAEDRARIFAATLRRYAHRPDAMVLALMAAANHPPPKKSVN